MIGIVAEGLVLAQDGFERRGHRLELERDVGNRADDRDQRDGRGNRLALAVARGDEIGDRGDVLRFRELDHAAQQRRAERRSSGSGRYRSRENQRWCGWRSRPSRRTSRRCNRSPATADRSARWRGRAGSARGGRRSSRPETGTRCSRRRLRSRPSRAASLLTPLTFARALTCARKRQPSRRASIAGLSRQSIARRDGHRHSGFSAGRGG